MYKCLTPSSVGCKLCARDYCLDKLYTCGGFAGKQFKVFS